MTYDDFVSRYFTNNVPRATNLEDTGETRGSISILWEVPSFLPCWWQREEWVSCQPGVIDARLTHPNPIEYRKITNGLRLAWHVANHDRSCVCVTQGNESKK
jgi:hypothetical protein